MMMNHFTPKYKYIITATYQREVNIKKTYKFINKGIGRWLANYISFVTIIQGVQIFLKYSVKGLQQDALAD